MTGSAPYGGGPFRGLSARLLLFTAAFVLLAEALLFLPSLAHRRHDLLREKGREIELVVLAAEGQLTAETQAKLRRLAEFHEIRVQEDGLSRTLLAGLGQVHPGAEADLRQPFWTFSNLRQAAELALQEDPPPVHLILPMREHTMVESVVGQRRIAKELRSFARAMLAISLAISLVTGVLVFFAIHLLMVRPVRKLTDAITAFRAAPDSALADPPAPVEARHDEIGLAAREFAAMRQELRGALWQQSRLAALGTAVAKISHDLRNVLATAMLMADRLERSDDPNVRRAAPMLVGAIDRAAELARGTLDFAREGRPALDPVPLSLAGLVAEAASIAGCRPGAVALHFAPDFGVLADRVQLGRALMNLLRNAFQAGAGSVAVAAWREPGAVVIELADDGPGLSARAREKLFQPFAASTRTGGAGLGLAIARDAARAHGGDLVLAATGDSGTVFRLSLPDQPAQLPEALAPKQLSVVSGQ